MTIRELERQLQRDLNGTDWVTLSEASRRLGVKRGRLDHLTRTGAVPSVKIGGRVMTHTATMQRELQRLGIDVQNYSPKTLDRGKRGRLFGRIFRVSN